MRLRASFLGATFITCLMGTPIRVEAQSAGVETVAGFLGVCREDRSACTMYVAGVMDGSIVAEARNHIPYRYCIRGASYLEISDAYLTFLASEQVNRNTSILSQPNVLVFLNLFMDARYRC